MGMFLSLGLGYALGSLNPAAMFGKWNRTDLTREGTGNLGTTNTLLVLGPRWAMMVLLFDVFKSWFSARLARALFPHLALAGMIACLGAIVGHCFSMFLGFQGGRGLAAFGGMILAWDLPIFLIVVACGIAAMLLLDAGVAATITGCVLFPVLMGIRGGSAGEITLALMASVFLAYMHTDKVALAVKNRGGDHILETLKEKLFSTSC